MDLFVREKPWNWVALAVALTTAGSVRAQRYQPVKEAAVQQAAAIPVAEDAAALEQVVVLQDGGVMRGSVTRNGERYVLARTTGETYIPASNVLLVAATLEDAYQQRRQRLEKPTAEGHLVLAEWCLRQDLLEHAERELADAQALEPNGEELALFERRLAIDKERRQKQAEFAAHATSKSQVTEHAIEIVPTDVSALPPGAVERFTRKVQPVLVNSCTTSGCHELGGSAKFQLDRAILRGLSNRRTTMNNLSATLALVDREQPQLSPLLTVPRQTHGGMKGPAFGPRQEAAFRHLYEWVALVTANSAKPSPVTPSDGNAELVAAEGEPSRWESPIMRVERQPREGNMPALYQESGQTADAGEPGTPANVDATNTAFPLRYGARLEHWQPRDPFDPEIFNRKFGPQATESENPDASKPVQQAER